MANKLISMTNISENPVRIALGGTPGEGVTEYVINPGEAQEFHENLCKPVPGAGPEPAPSLLDRMSLRTWPDGSRRPTLLPTEEVLRQAKAKAKAAASDKPPQVTR